MGCHVASLNGGSQEGLGEAREYKGHEPSKRKLKKKYRNQFVYSDGLNISLKGSRRWNEANEHMKSQDFFCLGK